MNRTVIGIVIAGIAIGVISGVLCAAVQGFSEMRHLSPDRYSSVMYLGGRKPGLCITEPSPSKFTTDRESVTPENGIGSHPAADKASNYCLP